MSGTTATKATTAVLRPILLGSAGTARDTALGRAVKYSVKNTFIDALEEEGEGDHPTAAATAGRHRTCPDPERLLVEEPDEECLQFSTSPPLSDEIVAGVTNCKSEALMPYTTVTVKNTFINMADETATTPVNRRCLTCPADQLESLDNDGPLYVGHRSMGDSAAVKVYGSRVVLPIGIEAIAAADLGEHCDGKDPSEPGDPTPLPGHRLSRFCTTEDLQDRLDAGELWEQNAVILPQTSQAKTPLRRTSSCPDRQVEAPEGPDAGVGSVGVAIQSSWSKSLEGGMHCSTNYSNTEGAHAIWTQVLSAEGSSEHHNMTDLKESEDFSPLPGCRMARFCQTEDLRERLLAGELWELEGDGSCVENVALTPSSGTHSGGTLQNTTIVAAQQRASKTEVMLEYPLANVADNNCSTCPVKHIDADNDDEVGDGKEVNTAPLAQGNGHICLWAVPTWDAEPYQRISADKRFAPPTEIPNPDSENGFQNSDWDAEPPRGISADDRFAPPTRPMVTRLADHLPVTCAPSTNSFQCDMLHGEVHNPAPLSVAGVAKHTGSSGMPWSASSPGSPPSWGLCQQHPRISLDTAVCQATTGPSVAMGKNPPGPVQAGKDAPRVASSTLDVVSPRGRAQCGDGPPPGKFALEAEPLLVSGNVTATAVAAAKSEASSKPSPVPRSCRRPARLWIHIYLHMQAPGFELVPMLIGRGGRNMRKIAEATSAKIRIRGRGSGHLEIDGKFEAPTPLMVAVTTDRLDVTAFRGAIEMTIVELRRVADRFEAFCVKNGKPHEGPFFTVGTLTNGMDEALKGIIDGDLIR